jgi:hypothetical protein
MRMQLILPLYVQDDGSETAVTCRSHPADPFRDELLIGPVRFLLTEMTLRRIQYAIRCRLLDRESGRDAPGWTSGCGATVDADEFLDGIVEHLKTEPRTEDR